jgi:pimeloyl-ACP methyl ester carboxylesterase
MQPAGAKIPLIASVLSVLWISVGKVLPSFAKVRQVIAFEQQGHGCTADIVDRPYSIEQSADAAASLLRHLGIERTDFFGYGNGGESAAVICGLQAAIAWDKF